MTLQHAFDLALRCQQTRRFPEAEAIYQQILSQHPNHPDALHLLGIIARLTGRNDAAVELITRAIAARPLWPEAYCNLANALTAAGRLDQAIAAARQAIALRPNDAQAYNNLGIALRGIGQLEESIVAYRQAIACNSTLPEAYFNLGNALKVKVELEDSQAAYRQAIALKPEYPEAFCNLASVLMDKGQLPDAIAACRRAIALKPDHPEAYSNLGNALKEQGRLDEAIAAWEQTIALRPDYAEAHNNLALALLSRGDYSQGWAEHEWRWKCAEFPSPRRQFSQPRWDGRPLARGVLLLHAEQGLGDTIQFARYVPLAAGRFGGKVIVICAPELRRLLQDSLGIAQWIAPTGPLPPFDVHCPLMSLPLIFQTTLETIPNSAPYLRADAREVKRWRDRLDHSGRELKIGLAWAGNPNQGTDKQRSMTLSKLSRLGEVLGMTFYSLQIGYAAGQAAYPPAGMKLIDLTSNIGDFADTAALISNLDLVISTCTSVAHLAGAMGRKTWVMLHKAPDWRWMLNREDNPWYPTARLFRQTTSGDWEGVVQRVAQALRDLARQRLAPC